MECGDGYGRAQIDSTSPYLCPSFCAAVGHPAAATALGVAIIALPTLPILYIGYKEYSEYYIHCKVGDIVRFEICSIVQLEKKRRQLGQIGQPQAQQGFPVPRLLCGAGHCPTHPQLAS